LFHEENYITMVTSVPWPKGCGLKVKESPLPPKLESLGFTGPSLETELRAERQMDGITKALARGVRFGRKHALTSAEVTTLRQQRTAGVRIKDLMLQFGLSKASVYRYLDGTQPAETPALLAGAVHHNGVVAD
jgi:hypothetical protein